MSNSLDIDARDALNALSASLARLSSSIPIATREEAYSTACEALLTNRDKIQGLTAYIHSVAYHTIARIEARSAKETGISPEHLANSGDQFENAYDLELLFNSLTPKESRLLQLDLETYTRDQIAKFEGITLAALQKRYQRTLAKLRKLAQFGKSKKNFKK